VDGSCARDVRRLSVSRNRRCFGDCEWGASLGMDAGAYWKREPRRAEEIWIFILEEGSYAAYTACMDHYAWMDVLLSCPVCGFSSVVSRFSYSSYIMKGFRCDIARLACNGFHLPGGSRGDGMIAEQRPVVVMTQGLVQTPDNLAILQAIPRRELSSFMFASSYGRRFAGRVVSQSGMLSGNGQSARRFYWSLRRQIQEKQHET
jgi:hypothetical protein